MRSSRIRNAWNWYRKQWGALNGWKLFLFVAASYTLLFLLLQLGVFSAFYASGTSFVWSGDGISQHYPRLLYICRTVHQTLKNLFSGKGFDFPLIDFHQGIASKGLALFTLPQVLVALFPQSKVNLFYTLLVLWRYYAAGLGFILMVLHFKADSFSALIGAVIYTFCGFGLFGIVRHPSFGVPMIYLPLLIVGTDKVLYRKKGYLLLAVTFLSLVQGIYFSCMMAVLCFAFTLVRFFDVFQKNRIREAIFLTGRLVVWIGIAALLSGIFVIPGMNTVSDTGRIGHDVFSYVDPYLYGTDFYERFFSFFMTEVRQTGGGSSWTFLAYTVLSVPAICLLFARHRKNERSLRILFVLGTVMLSVPAISYVMSGFGNLSNRFVFGYSLCVSAVVVFMVSGLGGNTSKDYTKAGIILVIYLAICEIVITKGNRRSESIVFLLLTIVLVFLVWKTVRNTVWLKVTLLGIVCFSIIYSSNQLFSSLGRDYAGDYIKNPQEVYENNQYQALSESAAIAGDPAFFRATGNALVSDDLNMAFYYNLNDLAGYPPTGASVEYIKWLNELEVPYYDSYHRFFGVDSRAALLTLTGNKYYAVRDTGNNIVPFGYKKIDRKVNSREEIDFIYKNKIWLPVGFTYDHYILREQYDQMTPLEKQETQLQAAVIEHSPSSESISLAELQFTADRVQCEIIETTSISYSNGELEVLKEGGTIVLSCVGLPKCETYLRIIDMDLTSGDSDRVWNIQAESDKGTIGRACFSTDYYTYSNRRHTQMINLGYSKKGVSQITITFPSKGTCKLGGFEVYCQPMASYAGQVSALNQDTLQNIKISGNSLEGTISVSTDKILCASIPYLDDWEAVVDGKPAELYHVNTAFIGVELPAGDHTVRFVYHKRGQRAGLLASGMGIICLLAVIVIQRKRQRGGKTRKK